MGAMSALAADRGDSAAAWLVGSAVAPATTTAAQNRENRNDRTCAREHARRTMPAAYHESARIRRNPAQGNPEGQRHGRPSSSGARPRALPIADEPDTHPKSEGL
jgi:hypothetical protein